MTNVSKPQTLRHPLPPLVSEKQRQVRLRQAQDGYIESPIHGEPLQGEPRDDCILVALGLPQLKVVAHVEFMNRFEVTVISSPVMQDKGYFIINYVGLRIPLSMYREYINRG